MAVGQIIFRSVPSCRCGDTRETASHAKITIQHHTDYQEIQVTLREEEKRSDLIPQTSRPGCFRR